MCVVLMGVLSSPAGFLLRSLQALLFHGFCALDYDPLPEASTTDPGHSSCCDELEKFHSRLEEQSYGKVFEGVRAKGGGVVVLLPHHHSNNLLVGETNWSSKSKTVIVSPDE